MSSVIVAIIFWLACCFFYLAVLGGNLVPDSLIFLSLGVGHVVFLMGRKSTATAAATDVHGNTGLNNSNSIAAILNPRKRWKLFLGVFCASFLIILIFLERVETFSCFPTETAKQQVILFDYVADSIEKANIKYWLEYGTLLGAVRHTGLIPWDTDCDIGIYAEDLEKTVEALKPLEAIGVEIVRNPAWSIWGHTREGLKIFWGPGPRWMQVYVDVFLWREAKRPKQQKSVERVGGEEGGDVNEDDEKKEEESGSSNGEEAEKKEKKEKEHNSNDGEEEECLMYREEAWRMDEQTNNPWETLDKFDCKYLKKMGKLKFEGKPRSVPGDVLDFVRLRFGKDFMAPKLYKQKKLFCALSDINATVTGHIQIE